MKAFPLSNNSRCGRRFRFIAMQFLVMLIITIGTPLVWAEDLWIDVRSNEEFAGEHLDGAVNIPHTQIANQITKLTTDKSASIKLYCRSGTRAGLAKTALEELGYTNVENVGGLEDAKKAVAAEH